MIDPFSLHGKKILITGASSGIGKATAIACASAGAEVIITGRNLQRLQHTFAALSGKGHQYIIADLTLDTETDTLVASLPSLDGVVYSIGINKRVTANCITQEAISALFDANFVSPVMLTKKLLRAKKIHDGASLVFISSRAAKAPTLGNSLYSSTKGALCSYAKVLALEVANKSIRVNTLLPGMIRTPMLAGSPLPDEQYMIDEKRYPLGRYGEPEEVAYAVVYLQSEAARWITGSEIVVDGGISLI